MKYVLSFLFASLAIGCTSSQKEAPTKTQDTKQPNIVLIFIDDEGYGDVGCYGATGFQTPNIDKLASEGMRFTNYYAAQPVCSVSRAGLLTGCYPNRISITGAFFPWDTTGLNQSEYTIAEMFKDLGYATACFGKWHLGYQKEFLPLQHGFDEFTGIPYSNDMWPRDKVTGELLTDTSDIRFNFPELPIIAGNDKIDSVVSMKDQDKLTTMITEKAVNFINRQTDNPFFMYVPHIMGHIPLGVSDKFRGKSEQGAYGDVMMEIDWSVGEITKSLEEKGLTENTIVIFTSDNGPWLNFGNHAGSAGGLREGKMTTWDGGQRVPFIIKWPGKTPEGTVNNQLACAIDLLPTCAAITDGKLSENKIDGVDISDLWKGNLKSSPRETVLYYKSDGLNAVRKGNWKLVLPHSYRSYSPEPGKDGKPGKRVAVVIETAELYDMSRDPGERFNVIESNPEIVADIMIEVEKARKELGDWNLKIFQGEGTRPVGQLKNN
ncbi:MAG: sulfatase [Flavobacteriales bacterium]|nr:sulfatase [Flavobacteriales bacterium]